MLKQIELKDELIEKKIFKFLERNKFSEYTQSIEWHNIRNEKLKYYLYSEDEFGEILWVCNLLVKSKNSEKYLYAPRGPILDYNDEKSINLFFKEIKKWMIDNEYFKLIINPNINYEILKKFPKNIDYSIVSKENFENLEDSCKLAKMNIIYNEEELMAKVSRGIRRNTKKSYTNGLKSKISKKIDLENFYKLYLETSLRHDFYAHDINYFKNIYKEFNKKLIFVEIWHNEIPVAMAIDIVRKDKLIYIYGASSTKYKNLLGMYRLHWEAIKYCIKNKIPQYDFGGVFCNENDVDSKDYGLYRLKKGYCYNGFTDIVPDIVIKFN